MKDDTIKIVRQSWVARCTATLVLGTLSFLLMGEYGWPRSPNHAVESSWFNHEQPFPDQCSYAEHSFPLECYAIIDNEPDKLLEMPRIDRISHPNPGALKKLVELHAGSRLWVALHPERLAILPLYPLSVMLCQLRR